MRRDFSVAPGTRKYFHVHARPPLGTQGLIIFRCLCAYQCKQDLEAMEQSAMGPEPALGSQSRPGLRPLTLILGETEPPADTDSDTDTGPHTSPSSVLTFDEFCPAESRAQHALPWTSSCSVRE